MATTQFHERIAQLAKQLAEEFDDVDESMGDCWLDAIENRAVEIGDALTAELTQQAASTQAVAEESSCPTCGKPGRYQGTRQRALIGRRGPVTIDEPEYYCPCCRKAFFPSDASVGDRG
jgi:hypothetical protein